MLHKTIIRYKSGVYKITNLVNQKFYVGSSVNIYNRFHTHCTKLKSNVHTSRHLQSSYNKYGKDNFIFEIIEYCELNELVVKEQHYIDTLKPQYNKRIDATMNLGVKVSLESRLKISEGLKLAFKEGRKIGKCVNNIPVVLFDLQGNKIAEFESGEKCSKYLEISRWCVPNAVNKGKTKRVKRGKYIVLKKTEENDINRYVNNIIHSNCKEVKIYDTLLNKEFIYNSVKESSLSLGYKKPESVINAIKNNKLLKNRYVLTYN